MKKGKVKKYKKHVAVSSGEKEIPVIQPEQPQIIPQELPVVKPEKYVPFEPEIPNTPRP